MARMKDSDDYITARAANPRTGLISPSVGTRTPCTPASPGEALKDHPFIYTDSPTAEKRRPILKKANEGRKLVGHEQCDSEQERYLHNVHETASPRDEVVCRADTPTLKTHEDQLVVHMPSAREPQPFAYPGYTPEQIEALEHYREKTRRVSNEGYDRRLFDARRPGGSCPAFHFCCKEEHDDGTHVMTDRAAPQDQRFTSYKADLYERTATGEGMKPPSVTVRERIGIANKEPRGHSPSFQHRRTSGKGDVHDNHDPNCGHARAVYNKVGSSHLHTASMPNSAPASRAPPSNAELSAPRTNPAHAGDHYHDIKRHADPRKAPTTLYHRQDCRDLSSHPPVRSVKPKHAASSGQKRSSAIRQRFFGGDRDSDASNGRNPTCTSISASGSIIRRKPVPLFDPPTPSSTSSATTSETVLTLLLSLATSLITYIQSSPLPQISTLRDPQCSTKEKVLALQDLLSFAAHVLAAGLVLAMCWKLGEVVGRVGEVVFWPLVLPMRVLGWFVGR